jgi:hypothetical protein
MPELTDSILSATFGALLLVGVLIDWPALMTALASYAIRAAAREALLAVHCCVRYRERHA